MGVVWGPNPVAHQGSGRIDEGVICIADNAYDAALVTCGVMTNDERLTADAKAKLSNESTGGSFYTLASLFHCYQGEDGYNYPDWVSNPYGLIEGFSYMYGNSSVWWARYASNLLASAKEDLQTILDGGSLGGGSGSGGTTVSNQLVMNINQGYSSELHAIKNNSDSKYGVTKTRFVNSLWNTYLLSNYLILSISDSILSKYESYNNDYDFVMTIQFLNSSYYNYYVRVILYVLPKGKYEENSSLVQVNDKTYTNINSITVTDTYYSAEMASMYYTFDGTTIRLLNNFTSSLISRNAGTIDTTGFDAVQLAELGTVEPLPPNNWPDSEPTTPTAKPVVPDPPEVTAPNVPTYDPKSYTNPVTTTNPGDTYNSTTVNNYTYNYDTYTATGEDVIPYLQAILNAINALARNLSAYMLSVQSLINNVITSNNNNASQIVAKLDTIITAINNACATINSGIGELDTDLNAGLGEIYDLIGDFQGSVHNEFRSLKTYLKSLFQWLANQFDYTFDGGDYDDSSILYWLRRIYYKLGAGRVNTRPTDPVADPVGIGDWLAQLFRNFLGGLLGIGGEALDAVLDALDDLRNKFPFSIPWDLAAILALLVADPVAPNFDVPQYTITTEGLQQVATYHIDLSVFDDVMVGVRTMETLVFAFCLAFKTDFFKGLLEVHGGE